MVKSFSNILFLLFLTFFSCGYHFEGSGASLPQGLEKISVNLFDNNSGYSGIASYLKDSFIFEFSKKNMLADKKESGGTLHGEILRITLSDASVNSSAGSYEKRISVIVNISIRNKNNLVIYERKNISEEAVFKSSAGETSSFGVPKDSLHEVSDKMARKIVSIITSNF